MAKKFEIEAIFRAIDRVTKPISRMQAGIGRFARAAEAHLKGVARAGRAIGTGIRKGLTIAAAAMTAFGVAAWKVIQVGADFEKTFTLAIQKFPGNIQRGSAEFKLLEKAVLDVGRSTEFTGTQATAALDVLGREGYKATQAVALLPGVIDFATTSGMDLAEGTDALSKGLKVFGLATEDTTQLQINLTRVMDVLKTVANSTTLTFEDIYEGMKAGGSVARDFGQNIETVSAVLAGFEEAGIEGGKAGMMLRQMMFRLISPAKNAMQQFNRFHIKIKDARGNMRDFVDILSDLDKATGKLGNAQRAKVLTDIFSVRSATGAIALLQVGTDKLEGLRKKFGEAGGTVARSAEQMRGTMSGSIDQLKSSIESLKLAIFNFKDRAIGGVIKRVTEWIRANEQLIASKINEWLDYIIKNFGKIISVLKRVGIAVAIVWGLVKAVQALHGALIVINLIMAANPVVLIIMGIVIAIAVAAALIITHWTEVKAFFISAGEKIKAAWDTVAEALKAPWAAVKDFFQSLWEDIIDIWNSAVDYLLNTGPISWLLFGVSLIMDNWQPISNFFKTLWEDIIDIWNSAVDYLLNTGPLSWLIDWVGFLIDNWRPIAGFFEWCFSTSYKIISGIIEFIKSPIGWFIDAAKTLLDKWFPVGSMFRKVWDGVVNTFRRALEKIKGFFAPIVKIYDRFMQYKKDVVNEKFGGLRISADKNEEARDTGAGSAQLVSPQERAAKEIEQYVSTITNRSEVTIKDETGRAEVTKGKLGTGLTLQPTGYF